MQTKSKRQIAFGWLIPGVIFLSNPVVAFYDILPDCIGYLMLCISLFRLADLNSSIADALARFKKMIWISIGGYLMQYSIYEVLAAQPKLNPQEIPTAVLLCSFIMAVPQIYFTLPAYRDLFDGFWQLAERHGGEAVFQYNKRGSNQCERMKRASGVFVVLLSLLPILPELSILTTFEYEFEKLSFDWYAFVWLFRVSALMILIVLFLVWILRFIHFVHAFAKDKPMVESIEARYEHEILPQGDMLSIRRFRFGILFLVIGAALIFNLRIEQEILLPGILCAIFVCIGVCIFGNDLEERTPLFVSCGVLATISFGQLWLNEYYTRYYSYVESAWDLRAYRLFLGLRLTQALEAICICVMFWIFLDHLQKFVNTRIYEHYDGVDTAALSARATERLHKSFAKRIVACKVLFFTCAVGGSIESYFQLEYPWIWWIMLVLVGATTIVFASLLYALLDHLTWQSKSVVTHKSE